MQTLIDYHKIAYEFSKLYYSQMSLGINHAIQLFHPDVICTVNGEEFTGAYNWLLKFANLGIARFEYMNITGASQLLNGYIIVTIKGTMKPHVFHQRVTNDGIRFSEFFILEKNMGRYFIKNYIISTG